ncbi:MAG: DUF438 domain-containing protein [Candidatus Portnoybacteria bacterium CG10_big_fil_rev_8_21_14_0_10_36_7]|uniref:DUF438 domain-containing protein n=1 Tax=Candidatus Portnoybacteria bacterium CG10_big_fil_rev_8_21_14_0_10_36_7 TaxID=1974812 RepID=A0A2M8KD56_9BACT|nr:MAG: DUF438 domain-containing protein [Candidatus Portnoybacteria bacterium CG10_big_fil_rev_8_21_14_0_10_36_7]
MSKHVESLRAIFKKIASGENPQDLKEEIKSILREIPPAEFGEAENALLEDGLAPENLRHLCTAHIEIMDEQNQSSKPPVGHLVRTFMDEHDEILHFLDLLETINQKIQKAETKGDIAEEDKRALIDISSKLEGAEPHHKREEEVLFPAMEENGVYGPPEMMRIEHVDLRVNKQALLEVANKLEEMDFKNFKDESQKYAEFIIFNLRDHIFKENNILYPTALEALTDEAIWQDLKNKCDEIGYCSFTKSH